MRQRIGANAHGGVAELAYAADLKSASSDCGFESHRPYQMQHLKTGAAGVISRIRNPTRTSSSPTATRPTSIKPIREVRLLYSSPAQPPPSGIHKADPSPRQASNASPSQGDSRARSYSPASRRAASRIIPCKISDSLTVKRSKPAASMTSSRITSPAKITGARRGSRPATRSRSASVIAPT